MRFHYCMKFLCTLCFLLLASTIASAASSDHGKYLFFVGTYTQDEGKTTGSQGIYAYRFDASTGEVAALGLVAATVNPSWIAIEPSGRFLYAVNELGDYEGANSGGVSAFAIDRDNNGRPTGKLTFLNEVRSRGADPCYVTVDKTGKYVLVANYTGGSVAVFPILADGKLGEATSFAQHAGHGSDPQRQEGPHAHSINLSPDNRFAFVDDLGLDELLVYKFDEAKGTLTPNDPPFVKLDAGSGPRHFVLAPNGKFAYVVAEMRASVTTFTYNPDTGEFHSLETVSAHPKDYHGPNEAAEIEIHPSGRFLYASNRGEDDGIHIYSIDPSKGTLVEGGYIKSGGKTPRSFEIDPTGTLLFAENEKSDNVTVFGIDQKTGRLTPTGKVLDVPAPVCLKFLTIQ